MYLFYFRVHQLGLSRFTNAIGTYTNFPYLLSDYYFLPVYDILTAVAIIHQLFYIVELHFGPIGLCLIQNCPLGLSFKPLVAPPHYYALVFEGKSLSFDLVRAVIAILFGELHNFVGLHLAPTPQLDLHFYLIAKLAFEFVHHKAVLLVEYKDTLVAVILFAVLL